MSIHVLTALFNRRENSEGDIEDTSLTGISAVDDQGNHDVATSYGVALVLKSRMLYSPYAHVGYLGWYYLGTTSELPRLKPNSPSPR